MLCCLDEEEQKTQEQGWLHGTRKMRKRDMKQEYLFKVFFSCRGLNSQQLISTERRTAGTEPSSPVDGVAWTVRMGREATSKEIEV